ncbi:ATP-dependent RNA helicase DBP7 [Hondaea fermentalgiana]|uniref:ATP-dependent RNA helicase n=1 Tax=Hondaea fermentalgiana TaxID=2315210 RepID=A0A2R5G6P3_9STRA|nr:ATP-dependent RNA helicase DBP7 [Hondaea fermentalgiana]|eukprot:GBG24113.1 ATP-dependent RNA helicase DBP7 [Hondaea fermentalgiana]
MLLNIIEDGDDAPSPPPSARKKRTNPQQQQQRRHQEVKRAKMAPGARTNASRPVAQRGAAQAANKQRQSQGQEQKSFARAPKPVATANATANGQHADLSFDELGLSTELSSLLVAPTSENGMGFIRPTLVQSRAIPALVDGRDVLIKSQTGSGKTLAFGLPIINSLHRREERISRSSGLRALILSPTRELCYQIMQVLERVSKPFHWLIIGSLIGGEKRKSEKARLRKGFNVLVATPGRFQDHLKNTQTLGDTLRKGTLEWLVLDEADRLTDPGFSKQIESILDWIDENVKTEERVRTQTVLCSATLSSEVKELSNRSLHDPVTIDIDPAEAARAMAAASGSLSGAGAEGDEVAENEVVGSEAVAVPSTLMQHYMIVEQKQRLAALCSFVLRQVKRYRYNVKMLLFVSCRAVVDFLHAVLTKIEWPPRRKSDLGDSDDEDDDDAAMDHNRGMGTNWWKLHGSIDQAERRKAIKDFSKANHGVLICTDVAARGLDLPFVDWIVQYDPPSEISEYVHRVGRTARSGQRGSALIFLTPSEQAYLGILQKHGMRLSQMHVQTVYAALSKYAIPAGEAAAPARRAKARSSALLKAQNDPEAAAGLLQVKIEDLVDSGAATREGVKGKKKPAFRGSLKARAEDAFVAYVRAYAVHSKETKHIFHPKQLHLGHVARAFGLREQPKGVSSTSKTRFVAKKEYKSKKKSERDFEKLARKVSQNVKTHSEFSA